MSDDTNGSSGWAVAGNTRCNPEKKNLKPTVAARCGPSLVRARKMSGQSVTTSTWTEHPYSRGASDRYARSRHVDGDGDGDGDGEVSLGIDR